MPKESNIAVVNEVEHEDIIYDDPDDYIQNEQDKKVENDQLKLVTAEDDNKVEGDQNEIEPSVEIKPEAEETEFETLDTLIEQLPEHFPVAADIIRNEIAPILANCDPGIIDHYVTTIKKKTKAESKRAVTLIIDEFIKQQDSQVLETDEEAPEEIQTDPEIIELADQIAQDPMLFKNKIDLVNQLGVIGERKNIGLNFLVMDSCLLPMGGAGSEALALKNSGHYGAGKSFPLFMCLKLYPKCAYHLITSGSDKSLYNIAGGLKHKFLILAEALALEYSGRGDNELAYAIRSLVSEGRLKYQYTGFKGKEKLTIVKRMEGPTSLLTTTIKGKLEDQLEDRLITMHPNTSAAQTQDIIERTAELASGNFETIDEKIIDAWKLFNQSLVPVDVVIPYSKDIASFVGRNRSLPISVRRAFKRVLSAVKTIALLHQKQRRKDEMGRVISEISDYAIAVQFIGESFRESIEEVNGYTKKRIKIIEKRGMISSKDLAKVMGVSGAAISQWTKPMIEKGVLMWVDEADNTFADVESLEKAKRSGKAFIKVANYNRLPTPFELTNDDRWDIEGELYRQYDLGFESTDINVLDLDEGEQSSFPLNTSADSVDVGNKEETEDSTEGVNALRSIPHKDVMKRVAELKENQEECDPDDPGMLKLCDEFNSFLKNDNGGATN